MTTLPQITTILALSSQLLAFASHASAHTLPASLASEAVAAAVDACEKQGYHVTATIVNPEGIVVATLRDTHAPPHTLDSAKTKAYTMASFAQTTGLNETSELSRRILSTPESSQLSNLPGVLFVAGGVAIKKGKGTYGRARHDVKIAEGDVVTLDLPAASVAKVRA